MSRVEWVGRSVTNFSVYFGQTWTWKKDVGMMNLDFNDDIRSYVAVQDSGYRLYYHLGTVYMCLRRKPSCLI